MSSVRADVGVVGAGASGLAAAIAAARAGARVVLLERYGFLGGMGTAAAIGSFCGLYSSGPEPRPIATGIGWEIVAALAARAAAYRFTFGKTLLVHYDPEVLKVIYDELVTAARVRVIGHVAVAAAVTRERLVDHVVATTQGEALTVHADQWIDASGDAVLAYHTSAATELGDALQPATLVFRMANVDTARATGISRGELNERMRDAAARGAFALPRTSGGFYPTMHGGEVVINMTRVAVDGTNPEDMTRAEAEARRQVGEYARWLVAEMPRVRSGLRLGTRHADRRA